MLRRWRCLLLRLLIALILFLTLPAVTVYAVAPYPVDLVILVDRSGSMLENDPEGLVAVAVDLVAHLLTPDDRLAVVPFHGEATVLHPLAPVDGSVYVPPPDNAWTDINAALAEGLGALPPGSDRRSAILLFTDGKAELSVAGVPPGYEAELDLLLAEALERRVPIFGVGFGDADQAQLARIAGVTAGESYLAYSPRQIAGLFSHVLAQLKGRQSTAAEIGTAPLSREVTVPAGTERIILLAVGDERVSFAGPLAELPSAREEQGPAFSILTVDEPPAGTWTVRVEGEGALLTQVQLEGATPPGWTHPQDVGQPSPSPGREAAVLEPMDLWLRWSGLAGLIALLASLHFFGLWNWERLRRKEERVAGRLGPLNLKDTGSVAYIGPDLMLTTPQTAVAELEARLTPVSLPWLARLGIGRRRLYLYLTPGPGARVQINGAAPGDGRLYHGDRVSLGSAVYEYTNPELPRRPRRVRS